MGLWILAIFGVAVLGVLAGLRGLGRPVPAPIGLMFFVLPVLFCLPGFRGGRTMLPGVRWSPVYSAYDGSIFENGNALPRVFSPRRLRFAGRRRSLCLRWEPPGDVRRAKTANPGALCLMARLTLRRQTE